MSASFLLILLLFLASAVRLVSEYERLVVFRLGRCVGVRGPGLTFLIPIIDRGIKVDLREQKREVPPQVLQTKDDIPVSVSYGWSYKVIDPTLSVTQVGNFVMAADGLGVVSLRSQLEGMPLIEALEQREQLGHDLRTRLDEVTERWGVKVTNVEIHDILPPEDIRETLVQQVSGRRIERFQGNPMVGLKGETSTLVHLNGRVKIAGEEWDAISPSPILPSAKVRVRRVILEIVEDTGQ